MSARPPHGFVLAATLWTLAILTIAVAYFADRVGRSLALARQTQEAAEQRVAFANTRAEVLFRLATTPASFRGLGEIDPIVLDDRPYRGTGGDVLRLQDQCGLVNVNFIEAALMSRFLTTLGVPTEQQDALLDKLRDYTDPDDLRRLNGAEKAEYLALGLPPPPNDLLTTPQQLKSVLGWRDRAAFWEGERLMRFVTTSRECGFNPNTAPVEVLASLPGLTRETALAVIANRVQQPIYHPGELPGYIPNLIEREHFTFMPGGSLRVTQQSPRLPWVEQWSVTLTPFGPAAPWRIDYFSRTVVSYAVENEAEIPKLPAWIAPSKASYSPP